MKRPLSKAQQHLLRRAVHGPLLSMSQRETMSWRALDRHGLIDQDGITEAGRRALAQSDSPPEATDAEVTANQNLKYLRKAWKLNREDVIRRALALAVALEKTCRGEKN